MKIPGHCAVTGEPCVHVIETWPELHPFAGQPRRLGAVLDHAVRVTLAMVDGSTMALMVSDEGLRLLQEDTRSLLLAWNNVKDRMRAERKAHRDLGHHSFSPEQNAHADATQMAYNDNVPLGMLCFERWVDHAD